MGSREDGFSHMFSLAEDKLYSCVRDSSLLLHIYLNLAIAFSQLKRVMCQL